LWCEWRTNKNSVAPVTQGEFWKLIRFESNGDATWVRFFANGTASGVSDLRDQVNVQVTPDGSGFIDIDGAVVNNGANPSGIPLETVADVPTNTLLVQVQCAAGIGAAPADPNDAGIASFDSSSFTVDPATGFVQLLGGGIPPALQFTIDAFNPPGTNPILPTGAGMVTVTGEIVDAQAIPIQTYSDLANQYQVQVQVSSAIVAPAALDKSDVGMCSFDNSAFVVSTDGWVSLIGGGPAVLEFDVDSGANVVPAAGIVIISGVTQTAQGFPLRTANGGANQIDLEIQIASTVTDPAADSSDCGVCCFDDTMFTIDATTGLVKIIGGIDGMNSITVDAATAPGVNPVVPSGAGTVTMTGAQVAAGTVGTNVIRTHTTAVNQLAIEVQRSTTNATTDVSKNGVSHYKTAHFSVDANAFVEVNPILLNYPIGTTVNLGINYTSPTFKVTSANGTALSATNPAYLVVPSVVSPGYKTVLTMTSDISFIDDSGASQIAGNTFGTTAGVAWNEDMPFYLMAIPNSTDTAVTIGITRCPQRASTTGQNLAKSGSAIANGQGSFFMIDSSVVVANYNNSPSVCIGSFKMRKTTAASNDWTVQALGNSDGIGLFNEQTYFNMVSLQFGATSNIFSSSVGGNTIPTFNQTAAAYRVHKNGWCHFLWDADFTTAGGVGAGELRAHLPFQIGLTSFYLSFEGTGQYKNSGAGTYTTFQPYVTGSFTQYVNLLRHGAGTSKVTPATWIFGLSELGFTMGFPIA
jgi:hypothetical protein